MRSKARTEYAKATLILMVGILLALGYMASTASAWDWDLPDLDDVEDWWDDTTDDVEDWWDDTTDDVEDWWDDTTDDVEDWSEQTRKEVEQFAHEFEEEARQNLQQALDKANEVAEPYKEEAYNILEKEARRQLCEEYDDPEKIGELERKRDFPTEAAIAATKLMPIYDPEKKEVHTFDEFARDLYSDIPEIEGSDLAEDPVRCAALLLLDSDYLLYAKIIESNDGRWMSIEEAMALGYRTNKVDAAKSEYLQAKNAYARGDSELVERHLESFSSKVQSIKQTSDSPTSSSSATPNLNHELHTWLLPIAVVTIAGLCIGLGIRNGRKVDAAIQ